MGLPYRTGVTPTPSKECAVSVERLRESRGLCCCREMMGATMKRILLLAVLCLAGCQSVKTTTTSFNDFQTRDPQTFTVAYNPENLEEKSYARAIASQLNAIGWREVPDGSIKVAFGYGIDGGRTVLTSSPVFGQTGGGTTYSSGSVFGAGGSATYSGSSYSPPTYGVVGSQTDSEVVFTRTLRIGMSEAKSGRKVFETTVTSVGSSGTFAAVGGCLIAAAFQDFPGENGKTYTREVPTESCSG